jgi:hypothetical protein
MSLSSVVCLSSTIGWGPDNREAFIKKCQEIQSKQKHIMDDVIFDIFIDNINNKVDCRDYKEFKKNVAKEINNL